jgi:hypothetical protein
VTLAAKAFEQFLGGQSPVLRAATVKAAVGAGVCNSSGTLAITAEEAQKAFELAAGRPAGFKSAGMKSK